MKTIHIATVTLMLTMVPVIAAAQTNSPAPTLAPLAIVKGYKPAPIIHAVIPTELGCHVETAGKLTKVPCLSAEDIAKRPHPAACTGADGDAACGMQSTVSSGKEQVPVTEAFLEVTLQQYSSSSDTYAGSGAYSLQLNTNFFAGPTTTQGWIQFALQSYPTGGGTRFCVWNWDLANNKNNTVCTPYNPVPLGVRARYTVGGFVCAKGCTYVANPPVIYGWMHWDVLDAQGNVCSSCGSGTVWAVSADTYGLANGWTQVSGSILGAGTPTGQPGAQLTFEGNTVVRNVLGATACPIPLAPGWTCNSPQLNGQYANTAGFVTAESNNLYYAPNPNWAEAPQSSLNCSSGFCWLPAYEIYPNAPPPYTAQDQCQAATKLAQTENLKVTLDPNDTKAFQTALNVASVAQCENALLAKATASLPTLACTIAQTLPLDSVNSPKKAVAAALQQLDGDAAGQFYTACYSPWIAQQNVAACDAFCKNASNLKQCKFSTTAACDTACTGKNAIGGRPSGCPFPPVKTAQPPPASGATPGATGRVNP
jgi:hypothetical protein